MVRAIDIAIVTLVSFILVVVAFFSIPASGTAVHFGFPSYTEVSNLLTGNSVQKSFSMQNSTSPILSQEYGLVRAQSAFYDSNTTVTPALPTVYITEMNFNSEVNASAFYNAQFFGVIDSSATPAPSGNLNISHAGAIYSIFPAGSVNQGYYYVIGYVGNFVFALFLYSTLVPQGTVNSLAELVVQSMT